MSIQVAVALISLWFAGFIALMVWTMWGRMAEWSYKIGMSPVFRWLYHGRVREEEVWVRYQKRAAWFELFFGTPVYALL